MIHNRQWWYDCDTKFILLGTVEGKLRTGMQFLYNQKQLMIEYLLTTDRKKSTCGLLWTKNLTGCLSMVTFKIKSGGVPGFTLGLITPSWWEWINVSSRSSTRTFFLTILSLCLEMGDTGEMSYLIARCCWT